jgi:HD-like signal output (HDOD) protein
MRKSILFVDNDSAVLEFYKKTFRETEYELHYAATGGQALDMLVRYKITMVISDINLGDMNGSVFLKKVKSTYPLIIRLLVCSTGEESAAFKIFQKNLARLFILKPADSNYILRVVKDFFDIQEKLSTKEILSIINSLDKLPVLPDIYIKVNQLIDEDSHLEVIARVIERDVAVSLQVLRIANSAFYSSKTGSVKDSILNLGLLNVKNILFTSILFDFFDDNIERKKLLWTHGLYTNKIMLGIYKRFLGKTLLPIYSATGLLHDIGKIILFVNFPQNYEKVFQLSHKGKLKFIDVEKEVLSICHNEIGAHLLDWWDIPSPIVEAALYHETPLKASEENRELVSVVHVASCLAWECLDIESFESIDKKVLRYLGFTEKEARKLAYEVVEEKENR